MSAKVSSSRLELGCANGPPPRVDADPSINELGELYKALYLRLVRRVTWRFGLSVEDAAEVVHDAFVIAISKLDWGRNPTSWLFGTVDRLALNASRKERRRSRLLAEWGPGSSFLDSADASEGPKGEGQQR